MILNSPYAAPARSTHSAAPNTVVSNTEGLTMTTTPAASNVALTKTHGSSIGRFLHYTAQNLILAFKDWSFLAFIVAMPTIMYLFFSNIYGNQITDTGVKVAALLMVSMATYGGLGAAMHAGAQIQAERSSGWFRQLMLTSLTPTEFMVAKIISALCLVVPAILVVFAAGMLRGVSLPLSTWFEVLFLLLVALLPMVVMGLVLGLWLKQQAAAAATTLVMLALSMLGGLFIPLDAMPPFMQHVGKLLPSYWAGQIGLWPITNGAFPWYGVVVISIWTAVLLGMGALGYLRAVHTSRR